MNKREELEQCKREYQARIEECDRQLNALPKERLRLRADTSADGGSWIYPIGVPRSIVRVFGENCKEINIDPAALAAHICRFGEPDVTREMEALEKVVRNMRYRTNEVHDALAALDAARKGGA